MAKMFVSYSRQSETVTKTLVNDIEEIGHAVWFDQELSGGQAWWNQILEMIRNCDVFIFVLDPESLDSTACKREYGYAADLGKPILPILISGEVKLNLLPTALSQIHFVDYRNQDRSDALRLARALNAVPPPDPLPDPLPPPPEVPVTYLGSLAEQIETTSSLSYEQQSALVVDLKRGVRVPETADDSRTLLERLRRRHDLFAKIAEEIDEVIKENSSAPEDQKSEPTAKYEDSDDQSSESPVEPEEKASEPPRNPVDPKVFRPTTLRKRLICALVGALVGTAIGVVALWTLPYSPNDTDVLALLITGAGGAVAGAITGTHPRRVGVAAFGAFLGFMIVVLFDRGSYAIIRGAVFGMPPGAILGAILGVILRKKKRWA